MKVDFANSQSDNIIFAITNKALLNGNIFNGAAIPPDLFSSQTIKLNEWTHVAMSFNSGSINLYINSQPVGTGAGYKLNNVLRPTNFIGISNYGDSVINAALDEIKIFNRPLTFIEIAIEMNKPQPLGL